MAELAGLMGNAESSYALQQLLGNAHGPSSAVLGRMMASSSPP
jgi:hypothetical protein